jgi:hypothetical protein
VLQAGADERTGTERKGAAEARRRAHDQHRRVEGAVLLGAEHLLALEQQQGQVRRVVDRQAPDRGARRDLRRERAQSIALTKAR